MEIDGGSAISLISERDRKKFFPEQAIKKTSVILSYYSGEKCKPKGVLRAIQASYGKITAEVDLYVVEKTGRPMIGRDTQWGQIPKSWPKVKK